MPAGVDHPMQGQCWICPRCHDDHSGFKDCPDLIADLSKKQDEIDRLQKRVDELEKDRERDAVTIDCAYGVNAKLRKRLASAKDWCTRLQRGIEKMKEQSALDHQFAEEQKNRIAQLEQTLASWARARIERLDGHLESDELS